MTAKTFEQVERRAAQSTNDHAENLSRHIFDSAREKAGLQAPTQSASSESAKSSAEKHLPNFALVHQGTNSSTPTEVSQPGATSNRLTTNDEPNLPKPGSPNASTPGADSPVAPPKADSAPPSANGSRTSSFEKGKNGSPSRPDAPTAVPPADGVSSPPDVAPQTPPGSNPSEALKSFSKGKRIFEPADAKGNDSIHKASPEEKADNAKQQRDNFVKEILNKVSTIQDREGPANALAREGLTGPEANKTGQEVLDATGLKSFNTGDKFRFDGNKLIFSRGVSEKTFNIGAGSDMPSATNPAVPAS